MQIINYNCMNIRHKYIFIIGRYIQTIGQKGLGFVTANKQPKPTGFVTITTQV